MKLGNKMALKAFCLLTRLNSKKAQTLVEYGLILALVAVVIIVALTLLGNKIQDLYSWVGPVSTPEPLDSH